MSHKSLSKEISFSILFLLFLLLSSCQLLKPKRTAPYSFFVAGHTYGSPLRKAPGLHPPFLVDFDSIKAFPHMAFGVLTGDIVYYSRDSFWDKVDVELQYLNMPIHFATGNHDEGHKPTYRDRYGITYYSFTQGQDLFLVLNPGLGGWNIWKEQLAFLKRQLQNAGRYQHIFVFVHHLLWAEPGDKPPLPRPNSFDGRTPTVNFWPEIMPLFYATNKPVYLFAGDVGANLRVTSFYQNQSKNVHILASGMGNGVTDNYLLVEVDKDQVVRLSIKWLQGQKIELVDW